MTIRVSLKTILLLMIAVTLAVPALALEPRKSAAKPSKARRETATEEYADDVTALSPQTRELQRSASGRFSYCLRSTAAYDCLAYGQDGVVRHRRLEVTAHGTGFAYKKVGNDSYLLTNDHVVSWPAVTTDDNAVTDVPAGCKRTESTVRIVANESDSNERDDTALSLVVTDPLLDVAVLRSKVPLQIMPYRIGRSADLRVGNAVTIQGYPLGIMEAVNTGKVINTADHDTSNDRDHLDFVVDAPLSSGNSGSPVLAISKTSGQLELVGIFHAAYTRGQALNVVVAIDQVLDLMTWFRKTPRPEAVFDRLGALERREFAQWLTQNGGQMFFNLSSLIACAHLSPNGNLVFELFDRSWPLTEDRMLIVVDSPDSATFGTIARVYLGRKGLLRLADPRPPDTEIRAQLQRIAQRIRTAAVWTMRWRSAAGTSGQERDQRTLDRWRSKNQSQDAEAGAAAADLAGKASGRWDETWLPGPALAAREVDLADTSTATQGRGH